ncbi:MAG: zinc-binding alcohol dehydrogenase family protein [Clostridiales bacterium]|jgi:L-gulonate 5-dehydrogenase|nr:zinc-binding alcohol dehydrogenase family protein [Clostridiales bacterium]
MKSVMIPKPGEIAIVESPRPDEPDKDEVIVRVKAAGICGSDVHIYHGRSAFATYPRIIGHEIAGEVYQVGSSVTDVKPGDKVAVDPVTSCGSCYACRIGRHNVCSSVKVLGVHVDGGYREYIKVNAANVHRVPDNLSWEEAAVIEPFSIAAEAVDRGRLSADDSVLICGAGPIGLVILQAVKRLGARAMVVDIIDNRLDRAKNMGAEQVVNTKKEDLFEAVMNFTDGEGANLIFEATGSISLFELCVSKLVSQAGRIVVLGFPEEAARISPVDIMRRELDIVGSRLNRNKFPEVIQWLKAKEIDPSSIISHVFPFEQVRQAFELFDGEPEKVCKIILSF